jgi:hypothetical protein
MAKYRRTPGERLIRIILKHRSNATLRQIAWGGLRGEEFETAKRLTKDLVVFEPTYRSGKQQASKTARLTAAGVWEAIRMSEVYDPTLIAAALAAPGIEAYLARLEKEKHPIAVKISGYRRDAELWQNRQERDADLKREERETIKRVQALLNKLVDKIPSKICKRDIRTLNAFLEKKGQPKIEPKYVAPGETPQQAPSVRPASPPEHRQQLTPAPPVDAFARDYAKMQRDLATIHESTRGFSNLPKPPDCAPTGETRAEVMARAQADGCVTQHAGLMFEGEEFGRDWERWAVASKKKGA